MLAQNLPSGRTTEIPEEKKEEKPYAYEPIDLEYWAEISELLDDKNYFKVLQKGFENVKKFGIDSDDGLEGLLSAGIALRNENLNYAATLIFVDIIKKRLSSQLAQKALFELDLIAQESFLDPVHIGDDLLNSNDFGNIHPDIQSFISYHVSMSDLINGFKEWGLKESKLIKASSYWGQKTNYLRALAEISQGKLESAEARLTNLANNDVSHPHFKERSQLQIARISFEKKDFTKASNIYKTLKNLPSREKSRVLLERAWSLYYLKNYSEALGLLTALRNPIYSEFATPERFILEMVIYKQLCYYEKVNEVAREYYDVFGQAIEDIKKRRDLKKNPTIAKMALVNWRLQEQANYINKLRDELEEIKDIDLKEYEFFKNIEESYLKKEQEVAQRLYFLLDEQIPLVAEDVLDSDEQVKFLDFTAKLDALRIIKKGEERNYITETIDYFKFNKVFWPVENEFWIDELEDYRVLLKSQCEDSLPSASEDDDLIRLFGEEFR